ncbi:hypothetical protein Bca52824_087150 [Brassica carinata]|uniref:Pyruvate carboxyltransferase domain-containing protein n=1 Tax=Brassica carinata TaxID=52824 RepID=A0A8X7PAR9_BRACI|nr:hypothetical protein Bca52824_087150 [Brassica carinata]
MISISSTASTMVVQSVVLFASSFPSIGLTRPYKRPSLLTPCCSSLPNKAGTGATDFKPMLPIVERWPEYIPNKLPDKNYVRVFDTTLRDGEQSPGAALTPPQKLEIARQLSKLRVDIMEVGFPASSEEEFETVKTIAKTVGNEVDEETGYVPVICALARCNRRDIEAVWEAVKYAKRPTILIFISTSDIHMKFKLKKTKEEVIQMAVSSVRYAKSLGFNDTQLGCEDAGRSVREGVSMQDLGETIKAGATTVNLGDTVGINMPQETRDLVSYLKANTPGIDDVVISVHCHNDLGVATANAIAGIRAGARQVDVTVNGIGERSGNAALEEVVMSLKRRGSDVMDGVYTRIDIRQIMATSNMVQEYTGLYVQSHKPIVGANCFVHESGIQQDEMLKNRSTYEVLSPEMLGFGRHALKDRLKELGFEISDDKLNDVFSRFKDLTKQKQRITDADLKALVTCCDEISSESLNGANGNEINSDGYEPVPKISSVV